MADSDSTLESDLAFEAAAGNKIVVDENAKWHPVLAVYRKFIRERVRELESRRRQYEALQRRRKSPNHSPELDFSWWRTLGDAGTLVVSTHKPNLFRVAYGEQDRALAILNAMCSAATGRGFQVGEVRDWAGRLIFHKAEIAVPIRISSELQHRREADSRLGGALSAYQRRISEPTGRLRLHVGLNQWTEKCFSEFADIPLEERLNDVFKHIHRLVAKESEKRRQEKNKAERREVERLAWEAEKARLEEVRRTEAEVQAEKDRVEHERLLREAALIREAERWKQSVNIMAYVEHVRSASQPSIPALAEWCDWAESVASALNPTNSRLSEE